MIVFLNFKNNEVIHNNYKKPVVVKGLDWFICKKFYLPFF